MGGESATRGNLVIYLSECDFIACDCVLTTGFSLILGKWVFFRTLRIHRDNGLLSRNLLQTTIRMGSRSVPYFFDMFFCLFLLTMKNVKV